MSYVPLNNVSLEYAIKASSSFSIPDICLRIREMLDDKTTSVEEIGKLVSLDPILSSKLLKLANSPLFRFRSQVDNIAKAINVLGGEALYNLIMAETAREAFEHFSAEGIDIKRFWLQSLYTGLIAKYLAKFSRVRGSERYFLLGLLHNIAELVVMSENPDAAKKCVSDNQHNLPWQMQNAILGFTYAQCSSQILQIWQLPPQISLPIGLVHDKDKALKNREAGILYTAVRAGFAMSMTPPLNPLEIIDMSILQSIDLDEEAFQDAINFSNKEVSNMLAIFNPKLLK